ncbi:tRNA 2-thiouridine(34) synthase MnmA [Cellulomonas fimi]|uniref:tRNA-specific 2-thiouridylase MnmA n=1 Tax=Cellulomonas fimi (strain ATCC 484 / DSM 20113 / JCM 1341 / CCUG 24087 / LMG 16345 / NBRC 15513 / NCIMB 8980 / NCTC 7547 / NRS-133) TaxID=590998 RepID=F4H7B7_CELFA|nr:tRNA 2-thiouridine(34) synthase MnmA [Cellulomonas fimi]AEE46878.1 tRNA (5-methylaminomethyl-2-thiouridylate)-methyltransferase [Cellulomonas fimi ATCC 484]NNH06421.1 tRNA 2-thiouridine(34) synthase MnmA [Cellulomonas fimi]VEH34445.1 tRNA-specific 2-thiouridylase mnmA [Cellulomonas fimi]
MRVLAALSGGVDSAVAAARAVDAGHDVVGVHMALSRTRDQFRTGSRGCCSIEDAGDARRAADVLGIPYYVWDLSERFEETVVADFLAEYEAGRTPNPCVRCNEHIKFAALLDKAVALGFDAVCTGHYARIERAADGTPELHRARDAAKDQSYVLAVMGPQRLARSLFPLGDVASKDETRAEAAARGLSVSAKPDSYDICFVADGDTQGFLRARLGSREGEVVDTTGAVVGTHDGAYAYTVGQRKGLALGRPAPDGRPRYVLAVEPVRNRVVVGPVEELAVGSVEADRAVWFGAAPSTPTACTVQVRAHGAPVDGTAVAGPGGTLHVDLGADAGLRGVAPGQSLVLYDGTRVLGQATVTGTRKATTPSPERAGTAAGTPAGAGAGGRA